MDKGKQIINKISTKVIANITEKELAITPNIYQKEFCKEARKINLRIKECSFFETLISKLDDEDKEFIRKNRIKTLNDFLPFFIQRLKTKNVNLLARIIAEALKPSFKYDKEIEEFVIKLDKTPDIIFEKDIQKQIQKLISKRIKTDKEIIELKSQEAAKLISLMARYVQDIIISNEGSSKNISNIKEEISKIVLDTDMQKLSNLKTKLVNAASSIEKEMLEVNKELHTKQSQIERLHQEIKSLKEELAKTKEKSELDDLTGLLRRDAFERRVVELEKEFNIHNDYGIVFFDIDYFKSINDTYGHEGGDVILKTFAKILLNERKGNDFIGRYGGEEFVAVVKFKLRKELIQYVTKIKKIVTENIFLYKDNKIKLTFSSGVTFRSDHNSFKEALLTADELLYKAKESGRNLILFEDGLSI